MRRLMLLRHAKTEPDTPSGRDQDRRLDGRGHRDATEIGGWIGRHPPFPTLVLVSPAMRALQTWALAWEAMKDLVAEPRVELTAGLYGADASQLLQIIRSTSQADPKQMMIVGHNPGMHELAVALMGHGEAEARDALAGNLPTAGLAIFDVEIDDWSEIAVHQGRLARFVSPKLIKPIASG